VTKKLKAIWNKLYKHRKENTAESLKSASDSTGIASSTIAYHDKRQKRRKESSGTDQWDTAWGQYFLKRMIVSVIYTFGIKGGMGGGRISEHLLHLQLEGVAAESSIQRLTKEIGNNILWYKELQEKDLKEAAAAELKELEIVLGVDETWLEEMLLVCQELTSGYLFLKSQAKKGM
jgi:hypothetical protein